MNKQNFPGLTIAAAAASLFAAGCTSYNATTGEMTHTTTGTPVHVAGGADSLTVKCYAANACKGQSACKTVNNACKGQNECKGQGFVMMDELACIDYFGRS
ncbi:MAG: hypothetical protein GC151_02720 [Betaproteobacteria bacterium]|nr:hypothetical protein [Betaproteobacteria bacterium]